MLHRAKMICSNDILFLKEVNQLRSLFLVNNYTSRFFDKVFKKSVAKDHSLPNHFSSDENDTDFELCFVKTPYVGIHSNWFVSQAGLEPGFCICAARAVILIELFCNIVY